VTKRMDIRDMWTVFAEYYSTQAKRYAANRPDASGCLKALQDAIITQRGYEEALQELIDARRRREQISRLYKPSELIV